MKNKSLIFSALFVFVVAMAAVIFNSCSKEATSNLQVSDETNANLYTKDIKVSDNNGNYVILRLASSEKEIVESYSKENYEFTALTKQDIDNMLSVKQDDSNSNIDDSDEFILEGEEAISISEEVLEAHLSPEYETYMLTVNWTSPEKFSDRGFDWHPKGITPFDYAYLKNNRCCWAIYYKCDVWEEGEEMYTTAEAKLKGGSYINNIGKRNSQYIQLHIKYRKDKHYSYYYHN